MRIGLRRRSWPFTTVSAVGFALCVATATLLPTRPTDVGPWLGAAVACLGFAVLQRSALTVVRAVAMCGVAVAFWALDPTAPVGSLTSVEGAMALLAGTALLVLLLLRRRG